ncbi:ABC transporter substrate-binding protein [uncultured Sphaerochaeta sp.]|uniref:ABC transporter substrate-binding protein n=1 Tax=uncultured Sphaerochaeta sp. TaxID=886478 RepID=UPI002A0A42A3|nr:ABC transporter substrate-binding protein [uncultured Sphaerochaeta sp.]
MKGIMKKFTVLLLAASAVAMTLIGCSGNTKGSSSSSTSTATSIAKDASTVTNLAQSTSEVSESSILTDQTINIGYGTTLDSLTPFRSNTARNSPYFVQLYETLGVMDSMKETQPYAAKSWVSNDNGFTYEIEIWNTIKDSAGNKITASDIIWFLTESKKKALKPVFAKIESVEKTGDYTFTIKLKSNIVGTFQTLMADTYIISEKAFKESKDEFGTSCITTSPYKVVEFVPSASLKFERRTDYWQDIEKMPEVARPLVKNVNYSIITEAFQLGVALETGKVDAVIDIASTTGSQFIDNKNFTVDLSDGPQGWQVFFSGADTSLLANNVKLRQAICYAIDANGLITAMCSGFGTQMWDVGSPRLIGFNDAWKNEDYYSYNLEKAKQLLAESGYKGEKLILLSTSSAFASRLGQLLQNYLAAVGINLELNAMDMALYTAVRLDGTKYDMTINTVGGTSLADQWSIRFDPAAYAAGDATSRKDYTLGNMLYKTWSLDGWTTENIDAVHNYLKENAIAYGLVNPQVFTIWSNKLNMKKVVKGGISGYMMFPSSQFDKQ